MITVLALVQIGLTAADLTGSWVASRPGFGGGMQETQFDFKQDGTKLTGRVLTERGAQNIVSGEVDGGRFFFEVVMNMMDQERRQRWEGSIEGDSLRITPPAFRGGPGGPPGGLKKGPGGPPGGFQKGPGGPPQPMIAKRGVSESIQRQIEADARRPKPVLPALKKLPYNGLAKTPPMGWNSWNKFRLQISDTMIREIADAMVSTGMRDAGYIYLNIDDGWQGTRDSQGNMRANERFPDMKALAAYVHAKGLKLGIYSSPGPRTCGRQEGSYGYEARDARLFASWGIDYIKYDWCSASQIYPIADQQRVYQMMGEALRATGRPIVYSICQYGSNDVHRWGADAGGNLWRTTFDIRDAWESMASIGFSQDKLAPFAGPGHWNDPDMLEAGNGGMNADESKTHFTLWAMLAAPLIAGNDVRNMDAVTREILLNKEVIALNQDPLGKQAVRISQQGEAEVWRKELGGAAVAVALFNKGDSSAKVALDVPGTWKTRDLWKHADAGELRGARSFDVPAHGVVALRLVPAGASR